MVALSKKANRRLSKGKEREPSGEPAAAVPDDPVDTSEEDEGDSDEDEENGGVSERGMKRLMELVGEEDLDELERARLGIDGEDDEDEEEESEGEDGEVDEEDGEEEEEEEDEDEEMLDTTTGDDSILISEADPDAVAIDEMGSDVSLDEDAVPMRKVTANNKPAMKILEEGVRMSHLPWLEHLVLSSKDVVTVDPEDDLQREMAFYKLALDQVARARTLCAKNDIPFSRPTDYYAEMVKSDEHMERVRSKLVEEAQGIKKSEAAKKQRELKKFGKQIQHEKLKQREQDKKSFAERVQGVKRKRKDGMDLGDEGENGGGGDEFGIEVEDALEGRGGPKGSKTKMPRHARDAKYSLGGGSRRSKQNTRESTNDFGGGFGGKGGGGKGGKGGKGGGPPTKKRLGKSRRK